MTGRRALSLTLRIGVTAGALGFAVWRIWRDREVFMQSLEDLPSANWPMVLAAIVLVVANVGTETWKWQRLLKPLYPDLTYGRSVKAVLAGMSTGLMTPNRVGEYAGRVLHLQVGKRWQAISLTFMDRLCQMLITLLMGAIALILRSDLSESKGWIVALVCLPTFIIFAFLLFSAELGRWLESRPIQWTWLRNMVAPLSLTSRGLMLRVMAMSLLRYAVFTTQYVLLLHAFSPIAIPLQTSVVFVMSVFLGKSILPVFSGLGELGVREALALSFGAVLGIAEPVALQATFLLFVINILLPALAGIPFVQGMRIGKEEE